MLLSSAYFPPVEYFALLARDYIPGQPDRGFVIPSDTSVIPSEAEGSPTIYIDAHEHFQKQTWRTRCRILGPNGPEILQVPIIHDGARQMRDIRVEYATPWIVRTERALDAAYRSSPFFEHYADGLFAILESQPEKLLDLNLALTRHILGRLRIEVTLQPTESYVPGGSLPDDFRDTLHPKRDNTVLRDLGLDRPYYQVFSQKFGFVPGLSILDLLFNEGPDAVLWLLRKAG